MRRFLLGLVVLFAAAGASAETCTFASGASTWSAVATITGAGVTGCTASSDDHFVVASGATVTVTGNITQDGTTASTGIRVASGGTLTVDVSTATISLSLNDLGLDCDSGSTCNLRGLYRVFGSTSLTSSPSTTSYYTAGDMVPCADGSDLINCGTSASNMRFAYPAAVYNESNAVSGFDTNIETGIGAFTTADVLCFFDPNPNDTYVGADAGNCYDISQAGDSSDPYGVEFNVRQGTADTDNFPLAQRDIATSTLSAASIAGQRTFSVGAGSVITADDLHEARWIRFERGTSGSPEPFAYKIINTEDDAGGDTITVGRADGVARAHGSGDDYYIDYGWRTGDPYFVMVPVIVTSATASVNDSPVRMDGTINVRAVVIKNTQQTVLSAATVSTWQDVWIRDHSDHNATPNLAGCGEIAFCVSGLTTGATFTRTLLTGGSATNTLAKTHGIHIQSGTADLVFNDVTTRHLGDDTIVFGSSTLHTGRVNINRLHSAFRNDSVAPSTAQLIDPTVLDAKITVSGAICDDCTDGPAFAYTTASATTDSIYENLLVWAADGMTAGGSGGTRTYFRNLTVIGSETVNSNGGTFVPVNADRFTIRDVVGDTGASSKLISGGGKVRNGFARGVSIGGANISLVETPNTQPTGITSTEIENVAVIDATITGTCSTTACKLMNIGNLTAGSWPRAVSRITFGFTPGFTVPWQRGIDIPSADQTGLVFTGALVQGVKSSGTALGINISASLDDSATAVNRTNAASLCLFDNDDDLASFVTTNASTGFPSGILLDKDPGFVDTSAYRFDLQPGGLGANLLCGATATAGIVRTNWALMKSGVDPESLGLPLGGGGGTTPRAFP